MMLKNCRVAYASGLWTTRAGNRDGTGKKKFNCKLIIPKTHPQIAEINALMDAVGLAKWAAKAPAIMAALRASDKVALHDGASQAGSAGFEGNYFISCRSEVRPSVRGHDPNQLIAEDAGIVYSGCYGNASIAFWAQDDMEFGKRINAQIRGFQFTRDGDSFASGTAAGADEFEAVSDTGETDDPLS
jgi:hypothetical protein